MRGREERTCFDGIGSSLFRGRGVTLVVEIDANRVTVRDDVAIKAPLATNGTLKEIGVSTGGDTIDLIVRAHDTGHFAFLHTHPEWHIERIFDVLLAYLLFTIANQVLFYLLR